MSKAIDFVSGSAGAYNSLEGDAVNEAPVSDPLLFLTSLSKRGDVVRYTTPYLPACLINHPDYIRHVFQTGNYVRGSLGKWVLGEGLLASEGPYWRSQRRLMQPSFQHERIAQLGTMMTQITQGRLERWENHARSGRPIDMEDEMTDLTLRIIGKTLFGIDWNDELHVLREAIAMLIDDTGYFSRTLVGVPYQVDASRNRRFANALRALDQIVYDVIDRRRRSEE